MSSNERLLLLSIVWLKALLNSVFLLLSILSIISQVPYYVRLPSLSIHRAVWYMFRVSWKLLADLRSFSGEG